LHSGIAMTDLYVSAVSAYCLGCVFCSRAKN
jgi:hypothetical protein